MDVAIGLAVVIIVGLIVLRIAIGLIGAAVITTADIIEDVVDKVVDVRDDHQERKQLQQQLARRDPLPPDWQALVARYYPVIYDLITQLQAAKGWPRAEIQIPRVLRWLDKASPSASWQVELPGGLLVIVLQRTATTEAPYVLDGFKLVYKGSPSADMLLALQELREALQSQAGVKWVTVAWNN